MNSNQLDIPISDNRPSVLVSADQIDRINQAASERYFEAVSDQRANPSDEQPITVVVTPDSSEQGYRVRLQDEVDTFTFSHFPVEATGYLLSKVRGHLETPLLFRGPDSPDILLETTVLQAWRVARDRIADGTMETPIALQYLSSSVFSGISTEASL